MAKGETRQGLRDAGACSAGWTWSAPAREGDDARSLQAQLEYLAGERRGRLPLGRRLPARRARPADQFYPGPASREGQSAHRQGTEADLEASLGILDALNRDRRSAATARGSRPQFWPRARSRWNNRAEALPRSLRWSKRWRTRGSVDASVVFIDLGATMRTLLLRLAGRGLRGRNRSPHPGRVPPSPRCQRRGPAVGSRLRAANAGLVEPLTDRELDVLVLAPRAAEQQGDRPTARPLRHDGQASHGQYLQQARRRRPQRCGGESRSPQDTSSFVDLLLPVLLACHQVLLCGVN